MTMAHVRAAVAGDLPQLIDIASHAETAAQWNPAEYQKLFTAESPQGRTALVVEQNGQVAGFMIGRQTGEEWEIENIAVTVSARRTGLGACLLGEFLNLVRERGGKAVFLEVRESNGAARALYKKWAFVEAGRRKKYYENPPEDALILQFKFP
jgi:ribosomal-protein-alanine N-acetyltransferase